MKMPAIKKLVENYSEKELSKAEEAITEGENPDIEIEGDDEGEQLTHVLAASWILSRVNEGSVDFKDAFREYTQKVRNSIS